MKFLGRDYSWQVSMVQSWQEWQPALLQSRKRPTLRNKQGGRSKAHRSLLTVGTLSFILKELGARPGAKRRNDSDQRLPWP